MWNCVNIDGPLVGEGSAMGERACRNSPKSPQQLERVPQWTWGLPQQQTAFGALLRIHPSQPAARPHPRPGHPLISGLR